MQQQPNNEDDDTVNLTTSIEHQLHILPFSKIRAIMTSSPDPLKISEEVSLISLRFIHLDCFCYLLNNTISVRYLSYFNRQFLSIP